MCGIAGIVQRDGRPADAALARAMAGALAHRGPDGEGVWASGATALGHRRLAIIDPNGSPQPMRSADGRGHIVFNGEIFNYRSLQDELVRGGASLRTDGDTEVVLELLRRRGEAALGALRGQFAFAYWDEDRRELWLARDRLGILPLYWYDGREGFAFGSEVKAILPALWQPPEIDEESVREYLAYRSVPSPHTLYRGIHKLAPGCLLVRRANGALETRAWWSLPEAPPAERVAPGAAVARVREALVDAVRSALVADVPVGAYLSGGIDSSLIVALMARLAGGAPVETFAAGFGDPRFDELPYARQVARHFGTAHHEVVIKPDEFRELWPRLSWHRDAPLSEPADVAIFRLAELARTRVKVLLSGEGSDELFAGYPKYSAARWTHAAMALPAALRRALLVPLERALPASANRLRIALRAAAASDAAEHARAWFAPFTDYERRALYPGPERATHLRVWERSGGDVLRRLLLADCQVWLPDNLLERGDRMSMAASVESRPPFMDHRLVELAFALPSNVKVRGGVRKWVVKQVAREHLPAEIVDRPKVGFRVPLDAWFRGDLRELARDLLLSGRSFVGGIMSRPELSSLLDAHERGRRNEELRLWTLLGLEIWYRESLRTQALAARP